MGHGSSKICLLASLAKRSYESKQGRRKRYRLTPPTTSAQTCSEVEIMEGKHSWVPIGLSIATFAVAICLFTAGNVEDSGTIPVGLNSRQQELSTRRHVEESYQTVELPGVSKLNADMDDPNVLNVHVVPHTHDDVGWLKTVEQYFFGENMTIQHACVEDILDSVVTSLVENPSRTFTYVEMKFFSMWWNKQDDEVKDTVRYLVANKQLGFVNGGWCMHDEAATHFIGMIDQTTLGHQFLKRELGVIPKVGWQLDPFGHSASQASIFASKVGFDSLYFGRIDFQDLRVRHYTQQCEGFWNSSNSLPDTTVFWGLTGSYGGNYGSPPGYCFDIGCGDPELVDLNNTALAKSIHTFFGELRVQSDRTKGNHIMITMGSDFQYQRAHINFANVDLLISTMQELQRLNRIDIPKLFGPRYEKVNVFYSSPEYYTECKHQELLQASRQKALRTSSSNDVSDLHVKQDDFMPYSDCEHCFWTGYFTSRSSLKRLERVASSFLLSARQINSIAIDSADCEKELYELEDASGVAQHHDGVSGTSKQHVAFDYAKRLQSGINGVSTCSMKTIKQYLLGSNTSGHLQDLEFCQLLNETKCDASFRGTQNNETSVYVLVYNGLAQSRSSIINLPVQSKASYSVKRLPETTLLAEVDSIPSIGPGNKTYRIVFSTGEIGPLSANIFKIAVGSSQSTPTKNIDTEVKAERRLESDDEIVASNEYYSAAFDSQTGRLKQVKFGNTSMELETQFGYYTSFDRDLDGMNPDDTSSTETQNSGAYIFRPSEPDQKLQMIQQVKGVIVNTSAGMEVHAYFSVPWVKTITRVMAGERFLEIEYTIGPIPAEDMRGKEIVSRLKTPIKNKGVFYTDSNGREFMERKLNYRPTWDLNVYEPVAGNYYPVNAAIYIEGESGEALALVTDRSQGGASLIEGSLEMMVQRRTLADDSRGVSEPLNETDGGVTPYPPYGNATRVGNGVVIKGKHLVAVGGKGGASLARSMMDGAFVDPLVFVGTASTKSEPKFIATEIKGLKESLLPNVMLITRAIITVNGSSAYLIRLGHQYGVDEDPKLSQPVTIDLATIVPNHDIDQVIETTLTANQLYSGWRERRYDWEKALLGGASKASAGSSLLQNSTSVVLQPMDIRTFVVLAE